jgi:alpha-galactosidase
MRIGADVAPRWNPAYFGTEAFFRKEPDFPSARNAIHNAITRSHLHRRWWVNDPDCLLLRARGAAGRRDAGEGPRAAEQHLTEPEIQTLATAISLSAGSLILSDDLPALGSDRVKWLGRMLPPLPRSARALDWFDRMHPSRLLLPLSGPAGEWALVALINWQDRRDDLSIDFRSIGIRASASYHVVDFWQGAHRRVDGPVLDAPAVPPHGVALVAIRPSGAVPCWLGDTLHISQGLIIDGWEARSGSLSAGITLGHRGSGRAFLALPGPPSSAWLDDSPVAWMDGGEGVYTFDLRVGPKASLRISWE